MPAKPLLMMPFLEEQPDPRAKADQELKDLLAQEGTDIGPASNWYKRYRIQNADIDKHGYTDTCVRCARLQLGDAKNRTP